AAALLELGTIRAGKDDLDGAIELWRESVERDPTRALAWANLGRALASRGDFDEAEAAFRKGIGAERPSWALHMAYGTYLADQSRYKEAEAELREVLRLKGDEPEAHLLLGRCAAGEGQKLKAIHRLRKALRGGEEVAGRARKALEDLTSLPREEKILETIDEALTRPAEEQAVLLKEVLKEEAAHAESHLRLAIALLALGKARAAEGHLKKVLKLLPDDPEALSGLATALRTRKKLKAAAEAHRQAIERAPNHAAYHLNYADTLLRLGEVTEAAREVDLARALEPHHPLLPNFTRSVKLFLGQKAPGKR
ncbi:MAG: tetratricopeptide repeat protein, partial [Planctomycetota bacterium]